MKTEFYSQQKMYINEVLYHIDEDYKKWCDTIDMVCEELLQEEKDDWFFNMTPDEQDQYLKDHPNSDKAKELSKKRGKVKPTDFTPDKDVKDTGNVDDGDVDGDDIPDEEDDSITLPDTVGDLKDHIRGMQDAVGADVADIAMAFKEPSVYNTVKAIGGGISGSSKIIMGSLRTVGKSLKVGASALHDTDAFQKLKSGVIKVDEFMQKNKTLATMSAVAVSGLAIGQWLRMSFSGDIESDFDLTIIPQAFAGEAGFKELIATPDGIKGMGLLSVGMATGGLPIWMGGTTGLALALTYSGLQSAGQTEKGKAFKEKMVKWAESMGDKIEKGAKAVDKKLGITSEEFEGKMFIENVVNVDKLRYKKQSDVKMPPYENIKFFTDGWQNISLTPPPTPSSQKTRNEIHEVVQAVKNATDEQKQAHINCDEEPSYYIKKVLMRHELEFKDETFKELYESVKPIYNHYKGHFNRPRPFQVAKALGIEFFRLKSTTADTPSYPSGHCVLAYAASNFYSLKYPQVANELREAADLCALTRIWAGLHYASDYHAGIHLADEMFKYFKDESLKEDAPVNATGVAVSTDTPLVRSRNAYKKKNKKDAEKLYTRILKRYDYN